MRPPGFMRRLYHDTTWRERARWEAERAFVQLKKECDETCVCCGEIFAGREYVSVEIGYEAFAIVCLLCWRAYGRAAIEAMGRKR